MTPAAPVDRQSITCTAIRDLLVDYLTERAVDVDYTTPEDMARTLAGLFWRDLEKHHTGIDSLRLDVDIVTAWRERVRMVRNRPGTPIRPQVDAHTVFSRVRMFCQDLARWAADEPTRCGPWVAPCPGRDNDTDHSKNRARRKAAMDQRTRTLLPALPALVKAVEHQLKDAQTCLATGRETPAGAPFTTPAGENLLRRAGVSSRIYADVPATGRHRDLTVEEERAFWAWAIVEVLRHTGMRIEEALELTHHSFVAYQLPTTGEIVPMLQVAPSKLDQERLLLVSPELGEVLTAIIHRVRRGQRAMPLVSAYDSLERLWSAPMPFLFQRRCGPEDRAIPRNYISTCLNDALAAEPADRTRQRAAAIHAARLPENLRARCPPLRPAPHVAARICGHRMVDTTLGYAAIYPEDVINHHRSFIARRRALRPGRSTASPPRRNGRTSWPTSSCGRSPSASAHATPSAPERWLGPRIADDWGIDLIADAAARRSGKRGLVTRTNRQRAARVRLARRRPGPARVRSPRPGPHQGGWRGIDWVKWGTVFGIFAGVITLLFTALATYYQAAVSRDQLEQSQEDAQRAASAQAQLVNYWMQFEDGSSDASVTEIHVVNRSLDPVNNVELALTFGENGTIHFEDAERDVLAPMDLATVPPCTQKVVRVADIEVRDAFGESPAPNVFVIPEFRMDYLTFYDRSSVQWRRGPVLKRLSVKESLEVKPWKYRLVGPWTSSALEQCGSEPK
ncbi:hypothetical protein [Streptomyces sp. ID05-04B]|uniref:hypothetical protein n=1 Tax=Streptomyces sp. ID05-04B TaxID=3028661 RepID=UPI0029CA2AA9|nr:hypothetical protein [Streptomyces sp. ID05-04B]